MIESISKSRLKAKMLEIFRNLEENGGELIVTDRGKPVLKIIPFKLKSSVTDMFASMQSRVIYLEDIDAPTSDEWTEI
jgi:antitoxin (DNA-binding transcriptional repressor) of toxin-antitoxin stability system